MSLIEKLDGLARKWRLEAVITRAEAAKLSSHELISAVSMNDQAHTQDACADELDALMPVIRQAMIDAEQLAAVRIRLPTKVETTIMAGMDAEEMAAFDSGYNAALDRAHLLLMASAAPANEALEPDSLGFGARTDAANNRATGEGEGNG